MSVNFTPDFNTLLPLLWVPVLYAETHYRFKYFFSRLRKSEPEIIADCPARIKKGHDLPVLLIIKDARQYPVLLHEIAIFSGSQLLFQQKPERQIESSYEEIIAELPTYNLNIGNLSINIRITYQCRGIIRTCWNDNHRGSSHAPLPVYISEEDLPRLDNCLYGETHAHTIYTSDQVEFGASLNATARLAAAQGLDFFCATDHSYDLDDQADNCLQNDPDLAKWQHFWSEVENFNKQNTFQIIPGEEVTVRNGQGRNVHCLVYNSRQFFYGSGDSAEKWLRTRSEMSIPELLANLPEGALALAAHPAEKPPLLQRLLIGRGHWRPQDCAQQDLHGLQFINHSGAAIDGQGKQLWLSQLLHGYRQIGLAGTDAHGNFARFRQIGFPFLTMRENYLHIFGHWRSGIYLAAGNISTASILQAFRSGACFMTDGPALSLQACGGDQHNWHYSGSRLININRLKLAARSSQEFSALKNIKVLSAAAGGDPGERIIFSHDPEPGSYDFETEIDFLPEKRNGYIRAEVTTKTGRTALSNPIWILA
jgi:hypothetical protein